jgi:hypothetical protein
MLFSKPTHSPGVKERQRRQQITDTTTQLGLTDGQRGCTVQHNENGVNTHCAYTDSSILIFCQIIGKRTDMIGQTTNLFKKVQNCAACVNAAIDMHTYAHVSLPYMDGASRHHNAL